MGLTIHYSAMLALLALFPFAAASAFPQVIAIPDAVVQKQPLITPSPTLDDPTKTYKSRRGLVSDLTGDIGNILSELGSNIPSYVASGVPNFFQGFPSGDKVQSSLGLDDNQVKSLPTQVLNVP